MRPGAGSCLVNQGRETHCWGSEESGAGREYERGPGCLGLRYQEPGWLHGPWMRMGVAGVGLLFEIWIVDASIFVVCCVHCLPGPSVDGWALSLW